MKLNSTAYVITSLLIFPLLSFAENPESDLEVLAQRGKAIITQQEFAARVDKIPSELRLAALRDRNRFKDLLYGLLLNEQLAEEAREAGFDQQPTITMRMQLAAQAELADAWLQDYVSSQPPANYEALAQEYYQLHREEILSSESIDVSHILISFKKHSDVEAQELAESIHQKIIADPALFDELASMYSEDSSVYQNGGKFTDVKKGEMVRAFEKVAFALSPGEISGLVKTGFGYHIIRLDAYHEPQIMQYDEVKAQLVETERKKHEERVKQRYLSELSSPDVHVTEDALREMAKRLFGEDVLKPEADDNNSG